ncbi:MAG: thiamine pyrophosphate-dependent dehydrogenase E1 component subunit alpha [Desulfobacteraceae bacterium]|nr:MAG: thiamine pyrophosphate-dependent dehydrogenase E1 component subunit alpha [Desulfobacteraceae bacterium]
MLSNEAKIEMLRKMLLIRHLENAWGKAYLDEEIDGIPPALSTGQEAVSVGACAALENGDFIFTTHRGQAPQVAMGLDPRKIMAELYCRASGYNKGKSYHVTDFDSGVVGMGGIVAGQVPVAGGMALAQKLKMNERVSLCFFGDGASNEGAVHETTNLAAIWNLPLILLCENNGFCISLPVSRQINTAHIFERAAAYGIPGEMVDGNDPLAVYEAVGRAVTRARSGSGPTLVEAKTFRMGGHLVHDPQRYRSEQEIEMAREQCPIKRFSRKLQDEGLLSSEEYSQMEEEVGLVVKESVEFARQSPPPKVEEAFEDLWCSERC